MTEAGPVMPRLLRSLCAVAIYLYPRTVRERHGEEMMAVLAHRWRRRRRTAGGLVAGLGLVAFLARDLLIDSPRRRGITGASPWRRRLRGTVASIGQDVRYALRGLARAPGFTAAAVVTLALGIGANAAVFTIVDGVLLEPLPYPRAERIQQLMPGGWHSARQVEAIRDGARAFATITPVGQAALTLRREGGVERLGAALVGPDYFRVLGIRPALGRGFGERDSLPGSAPVAMLSHELWRREFGGDPEVVGRSVELVGEGQAARTIVGVLPPGHDPFAWRIDALAPMVVEPGSHDYRDNHRYRILGRLTEGITVEVARAELRGLVERLVAAEDPPFSRDDIGAAGLVSLQESRVGAARSTLLILLAAVGVVLLMGCVNVANLLLARSGARERELAVRRALGAGRARIIRQLLTESTVLALLGGGLGVAVAVAGVGPLATLLPTSIPRQAEVQVDASVLGFSLAASLAAGLLFGVLPALRAGRPAPRALRSSRSGAGASSTVSRLPAVLVGAEVGLAVVLLVAAALLGKSLWLLQHVDPGFDPEGLSTIRVAPPEDRYPEGEPRAAYYRELVDRVLAVPGVEAAGAVSSLPVGTGVMGVGISPDGAPVPEGEAAKIVSYRAATPGALEALRVRLLEGRLLRPADDVGSAVGVINRRLAEEMWPADSAVGRQLHWSTGDPWLTVAGVLEDVHQGSLAEAPDPEVYVSYARQGTWLAPLHVVVRHDPDTDVLPAVREAVLAVDDRVPVTEQGRLTARIRRSLAGERGWAMLFGSFALLALVLSAVGVFGVMSYVVSRRRHEVGVRMALGARRADVVRHVLRSGAPPLAAGLLLGCAGALVGGRVLEGLLYRVAPGDPSVIVASVLFLGSVALVANLLPAIRASRVDPLRALRSD